MRFSIHIIAISMLSIFLQGCGKPDRNTPHEYIQIHAFSSSNSGTNPNDISTVAGSLIKWESNFFELGSGRCQDHLSKFTDKDIRLHLRAWNVITQEAPSNGSPALALQLQCVAKTGRDEECVQETNKAGESIADPMQRIDFLFAAISACQRIRRVDQPRLVMLNERQ